MQEQVSLGAIEITCTGVLVAYEPILAIYELPYLFDNREQITRFHQSQAARDVARRLEARNILLLGYFENGFRQITNNVRPINAPADVRGLVIRTPENPAQMETFRQLGAVVTPMPFGELYSALQQGVVDGQENPLQNIVTARFHEVQRHVAITNHIYNSAYLIVGRRWLESLPADLRQIVVDGLKMAEEWQMREAARLDSEYLEEIRRAPNVQITFPNVEAFRTAVMPVHQTFINQFGRDAQVILDAINAAR
jgi:tripartite ATP-independent transporter DctP family solute receptor